MSNTYWLVLLDTDRIHDFVFGTNKLKEIRGASRLLDELNGPKTFDLLTQCGEGNAIYKENSKEDKELNGWIYNDQLISSGSLSWEALFIGGGSGKILFSDKSIAENFCQKIEKLYSSNTNFTASITTAIIPFSKLDYQNAENSSSDQFQKSILLGEMELHRNKMHKRKTVNPITSPFFEFCHSSGHNYAQEKGKISPFYISKANSLKRQFFKETQQGNPIEKLEDIGKRCNNYIGLVYADGNRMSEHLKSCNSPKEFRDLSLKVVSAIQGSIENSLNNLSNNDTNIKSLFLPLLVGGDDVICALPADTAIEFAIELCKEFEKLTLNTDEKHESITLSIGVLITHANYPIFKMMDYAEELLRSAKRYSWKHTDESYPSTIDFMILKGDINSSIKQYRENDLTYFSPSLSLKEMHIFNRPYTTEKLQDLLGYAKNISESFPRNKLKSLYLSLFKGYDQSLLDYLLLRTRLEQKSKDQIIPFEADFSNNNGLWRQEDNDYYCAFPDLIELTEFIKKEEEA